MMNAYWVELPFFNANDNEVDDRAFLLRIGGIGTTGTCFWKTGEVLTMSVFFMKIEVAGSILQRFMESMPCL